MEWLWACLLLLAALDQRTRPLAALTAIMGVLNYAACLNGLWRAPVAVDVILGVVAAEMAHRLPPTQFRPLAAALAITPLVHGWHWVLWDAGRANDIVRGDYYTLLALLFSVKVIALSGPGVVNLVGIFSDGLIRSVRFVLDSLAPVPRQRPRPARW